MHKLNRRIFLVFVFALALNAAPVFAAEKSYDSRRWEKNIAAYEAGDKTNPPPRDVIVFIGSSSILKWTTLAQDFPEYKVINRGFGGSHLCDSVFYADRIVIPYKPKIVVLFAGSNDINFGKTPEQVLSDFRAFVEKVQTALPKTRIAYISTGISPSRWVQVEKVKVANKLISDFIAKKDKLVFINVFPAMLGADGKPKPDIYAGDKLHLNAKGYALWTEIVRPFLK